MALSEMALNDAGPGTVTVTPKGTAPTASEDNPGGPNQPYTPSAGAAPPVTPTAGPDSISVGGTPAYTPDYGAAIQSDPGYQGTLSANQQAQASAQAQRQAALRQQVIQYGGLPDGFKDPFGDIDQATLDAAKANQYSTLANLRDNYQKSVSQFQRALAARGALQSGDLNYGQNQLDQGFGQNQYDAGNTFGNAGQGILNQYSGVLDSNARALAGSIQGAATNAYNDPANRPTEAVAGSTANRNADLSNAYGVDIYDDGSGNYYTRDGNAWTPPGSNGQQYDPGQSPWNVRTPGVQY